VGRLDSIYGYDNEGALNWEWYPNDRGVGFDSPNLVYDYDVMKRLAGIRRGRRDVFGATTWDIALAGGAAYGPSGNLLAFNYLGYSQTRTYNSLQQLTRIQASGSGLLSFDEEYRFSSTQNNARITQSKDWVSGEEVTYVYDDLNRLISAYTTGPEWGVNFTYDGFGNKTAQTAVPGKLTHPALSLLVNPANNRVMGGGVAYDANGNLTAYPGGPALAYDVENRMTGDGGAKFYSYDPANQRVWDGAFYTFWSLESVSDLDSAVWGFRGRRGRR
jgi:YD repeat-containing protein